MYNPYIIGIETWSLILLPPFLKKNTQVCDFKVTDLRFCTLPGNHNLNNYNWWLGFVTNLFFVRMDLIICFLK